MLNSVNKATKPETPTAPVPWTDLEARRAHLKNLMQAMTLRGIARLSRDVLMEVMFADRRKLGAGPDDPVWGLFIEAQDSVDALNRACADIEHMEAERLEDERQERANEEAAAAA